MEWRIVLPVLCLIAAITSPTSVMSQTVNQTAKVAKINLRFSIVQDFKEIYSNFSNNETMDLRNNITRECSAVYRSRFTTFAGMNIQKFSNGSIVVDSVLDFNTTNGIGPNVTEVKETLVAAIRDRNFTFLVSNSSINATDITEPSATTSPPPVTNQTVTPATTQTTPAKVTKVNLAFSIARDFKTNYNNLSDPETISLSNNITNEFSKVYRSRFANFVRMDIKKFSQGSVVVDSVLEFDSTNGSAPNATDVKDTLLAAINNGNFSFTVSNSSINASVIPDTNVTTTPVTQATTVSAASNADYNITFKLINQDFQNDLSNMSSNAFTNLAKNVTTELDGFYKGFRNFNRSKVLRFRSGSVIVDGLLGFNSTVNNPSALELAKGLAAAVRNGTVKLAIDPASINITDSTGTTANRSPVLASMLTAVWMTLASLLLSAVMH